MSLRNESTATVQPLREARKAFTRQRICDAAVQLFYEQGYAATTVGQIADAAGTRSSTLYTHYADKEAILAEIADRYAQEVRDIVALLPGPNPSYKQLERWVYLLADYVDRVQAPTELMVYMGDWGDVPKPVKRFGRQLLLMFAEHLPVFEKATRPGPRQALAQAWCTATLRELCCAVCAYARQQGEVTKAGMTVATTLLYRLVSEKI